MGCASSTVQTWEEWETEMEVYERQILHLSGFKDDEYDICWTTIEMDNKPFKVRTFYFGKEQRDKPTLLLTHGNMSQIVGYFRLNKLLAEKYRIVAYDNMSLGMSTRWTETAQNASPETAETWIREYATKLINALDLPEKFLIAGHSWGGYFTMMIGTLFPERIESMFLLSSVGTHTYNPETFDRYSYVSMRGNTWELASKSEADEHISNCENAIHPMKMLHEQRKFVQNMIISVLMNNVLASAVEYGGHSKALIEVFKKYWRKQLETTTSTLDMTMAMPFKNPMALKHSMTKEDRLNNEKCSFPMAMAFGDRDFFASSIGAEDILENAKKWNGGQVNLFKM